MLVFLHVFRTARKRKWTVKINNPRFVDEENIPLVHDDDYND